MHTKPSLVCAAGLAACWLPALFFDRHQLPTVSLATVAALGLTTVRLPKGTGGDTLRALSFFVLGGLGLAHSLAFLLGAHGFDDAFFWHLEPVSILEGARAYPYISAAVGLVAVAVSSLPLVLRPTPAGRRLLPWLLVLLGTLPNPAFRQAYRHLHLGDGEDNAIERLARSRLVELAQVAPPARPRSVVVLYLESLERSWQDTQRMGRDLMPRLRESEKQGLVFDEMRQMPGTGWTLAGTFASQCGLPLSTGSFGGNQVFASANGLARGFVCLGDVLQASGYRTSFLQAGSAEFSGTGQFLLGHGFERVEGAAQLASRVPPQLRQTRWGWGYHDETILDLTWQEVKEAAADERPFLVGAATIDTHPPAGMPGPSCGAVARQDDRYMDVVRCADLVLDRFLSQMRSSARWRETVLVLLSDHLAMDDATLIGRLRHGERRLLFDVFGGSIVPGVNHAEGTHFDVAPTLLELAGFAAPLEFPLGHSLLSHDQGYVRQAGLTEENVASVLLTRVRSTPLFPDDIRVVGSRSELWVGRERFDLRMNGFGRCRQCYRILGFDRQGKLRRLQFQREWPSGFDRGEAEVVVTEHSESLAAALGVGSLGQAHGRGLFLGAPRQRTWRWYPFEDELLVPKDDVAAVARAARDEPWFAWAFRR
ncbi:MAG TPA: sulfatase-like hydrolase/transferase [Vicinamibacteria bacterium]|nr:sulfatase-like hydrolase/transferase [Vicinamibacteria bacterium]